MNSLSAADLILDSDPFHQFKIWYQEAIQSGMKNPDAMTLATATKEGIPSGRTVLFKGIDTAGIRFFTNFQSRKGHDLESNPYAALVFYWSILDRQVRIEGKVERLTPQESDTYWKSRPRASQIGSFVSPQSQVISSRKILEDRFHEVELRFKNRDIPRPDHWGGFCLKPERFEFWLAGDFRLHDRFVYSKSGPELAEWKMERLAP